MSADHPLATKLAAGLHLIATPIGAARDITLRALDILASADVLAAEDTRTLRHLMEIHGIAVGGRLLVPYHDHNGEAARPRILGALRDGKTVAYASEAGTPMVADPGMKLARAVIEAGYEVYAAPGPSAVLAALTVSGLPTDRFLFAGFPPAAQGARRTWIAELAAIDATLVIYESPKRVSKTLRELCEILGAEREIALCRELTKRFEEIKRSTIGALAAELEGQSLKGEIVLVVGRPVKRDIAPETVEAMLLQALAVPNARIKEVAHEIAERTGLPKRDVYQSALRLSGRQ